MSDGGKEIKVSVLIHSGVLEPDVATRRGDYAAKP